jgi:hypothetical protein
MEANIVYKEESYRIMGACFEVYFVVQTITSKPSKPGRSL